MDIEKLIDAVTKVILERLQEKSISSEPSVVQFGDVPEGVLSSACQVRKGATMADVEQGDYILLTAECFRSLHGITETKGNPPMEKPADCCEGQTIDLRGKRLIHERDLREHNTKNGDRILIDPKAIVTALAFDYAKSIGAKLSKEG